MTINGNESKERPETGFLSVLRAAALSGLLVGAVGSGALVLHAGQRKHSPRMLMVLFAIWVLSPFVALVVANIVSKGWSVITRATLHSVMLVLALGSLAMYGDVALGPLGAKTVPVFVIVPPASWLFIATAISMAALISRSPSRRR